MATYIRVLKDCNGDFIAPETKAEAVEMASGGTAEGEITAAKTRLTTAEGKITTAETKLSGIETGATADMTAAEILTAIKTVDGAGTGLDADLLDGNQAAAFALLSGATMAGVLTAQTNTSYGTRQVRNVIINTTDAVLANMQNGDIWIKI